MEDLNRKIITSRAFSKAAMWQIIITGLVGLISLLMVGFDAALSAVMGGASVVIGSYAGMRVAQNNPSTAAASLLITLLKAEALKIVIVALLLLAIFKYYQGLVPLSLIGGLAGSALASGAGLRAVNNEK